MAPSIPPHPWRDTPRNGDVDAVRALVDATGAFRPDEVDVAAELVQTALREGPSAGYHFLFPGAPDDSEPPNAYICYGEIPCTVRRYDLYWIAVHPGRQQQGIGRALLREALKRMAARGGRRCFVQTSGRPDYAATRRFYEKNGATPAARVTDYYDDGDDLLIYQWTLAP